MTKRLALVGRFLLSVWAALGAGLWIALIGTLYLTGARFDRHGSWMNFWQRLFSGGILLFVGARVRVEGRENIPAGTACVLMGNHSSYLDIPAVVIGMRPLGILFVAKRELLKSPFLGWALAVSHHIKIDRGNREQAVAALRKARTKLKSGIALTVFPEGTRSPDGHLLPFKKGGFHMALDSEFPILPITIRGSRRLMGKKSFLPRPGTITVCVHPLRFTQGLAAPDLPRLMREVRADIESGLEEGLRGPRGAARKRSTKEGE